MSAHTWDEDLEVRIPHGANTVALLACRDCHVVRVRVEELGLLVYLTAAGATRWEPSECWTHERATDHFASVPTLAAPDGLLCIVANPGQSLLRAVVALDVDATIYRRTPGQRPALAPRILKALFGEPSSAAPRSLARFWASR